MKKGQGKALQIASVIAIACTMLEKLMGLLREIKITEALGASVYSDAYNIAYLLVITIFGLYSSAYSNSLMPIAAELYTKDKRKLHHTVNSIVTFSLAIAVGVIVLVHIFPGLFVKMIAANVNSETAHLAGSLLKISIWGLIFLVLNSAYAINMRIYEKNIYPTIVSVVFPIPILIALFSGVSSPYILLGCVVLGYAFKSILLLAGNLWAGFKPFLCFRWRDQKIIEFLKLMPPMLLSSGLLQINSLVDNQVAAGFGVGSVTALSLASKVNSLAYTVFSTSLMQIVYAAMTKAYMKDDRASFQDIVKKQTRMIMMFVVPCFIILVIFSKEIIQMLFVRGNYTMENAMVAGGVLRGYAFGLIFFVLRDICIYIYYSAKNSKFPSMITGVSVIINVVLNLVMSYFLGIKGVAYATSITAVFSLAILLFALPKKVFQVHLLSVVDSVTLILSAILVCGMVIPLKTVLSFYNVWCNIFIFAAAFLLFWLSCFVLQKFFAKIL